MGEVFVSLVTNRGCMVILFLGLLLVLHLGLVSCRELSPRTWKRIEYGILSAAALGLLLLVGDVRRAIASNFEAIESRRLDYSLEHLGWLVQSHVGHVCVTFRPSPGSPENLDELQLEYKETCAWLESFAAALPGTTQDVSVSVVRSHFRAFPSVDDSILRDLLRDIRRAVDDYEERLEEYEKVAAAAGRRASDMFLTALSPLLLVAALSFQVTKVSAELRRMRSQENNP